MAARGDARPAASTTVLHGRGHELDTIRTLLDAARAGTGGVLVVEGEPGAGKSALLAAAAARAADFEVLRTRGIQSEAELAFTGLTELLAPLAGLAESLPPDQHRTLRTALDARGTAPAGQLPLATAVLALLTAAARRRPVLALVDDAHWLDGSSLAAVGFVARRLSGAPIALLVARRGPEPQIGTAGAVELRLRGLGPEAARGLLADLGVEARAGSAAGSRTAAHMRLAGEEFDRLLAETRGNPLALIEMARLAAAGALDLASLAGGREPLPSGVQLAGLYHDRVMTLPERTRRALITVAASFTGEAAPIQAALYAARLDLADLAPAEQAGHIELTDGGIRFAHPLLRSAVYHGAADADVRDAHDRLAAALTTATGPAAREQRAWHRSYATAGPDSAAATGLAEVAAAAARRGAPTAARQAYQRAAVIAPDPAPYLIEAAVCARVEGDADAALELLDAAEATLEKQGTYIKENAAVLHARIGTERARVDLSRNDPARLMADLAAAAETAPDPMHAADLTVAAAAAAILGAHYDQARTLSARAVHRAVLPATRAAAHAVAEHLALLLGEPAPDPDPAPELPDPADLDTPLEALIYPAWTAALQGVPHPRLAEAIKAAHDAGARSRLPALLTMAAELDQRAGHWDVARGRALAAADIGADLGQPLWPALALAVAARIAAYRGDRADLAELETRLAALPPVPAGHPAELAFRHARAVLALDGPQAGDEREAAVAELQAVEDALRAHGIRHPEYLPVRADLDELLDREPAADSAREPRTDPFQSARRDLQAARRLRERRHHAEARALLEPAGDTFRRLRARRWQVLCEEELTRLVAAKAPEPKGLTPYETQVARHVGAGRTNNETAAALFISPKTVEYHLRNLYKKLGIRSRTELARIVATWEGEG